MNFNDEFKQLNNVETKTFGNYITEGFKKVTITECSLSPTTDENPYIQIIFEDVETKGTLKQRFYRAKPTDSEANANRKLGIIKTLFENAGIDLSKATGDTALKMIVGKKINVAFVKAEKIGKDSNQNNKPIIKNMVEYWYSSADGTPLSGDMKKLHKPLNAYDENRYKTLLEDWARLNAPTASQIASSGTGANENLDLPF